MPNIKSSMCAANEHDACGATMQHPSGKKFRCKCECHREIEKPSREYEVDDDDDDDY